MSLKDYLESFNHTQDDEEDFIRICDSFVSGVEKVNNMKSIGSLDIVKTRYLDDEVIIYYTGYYKGFDFTDEYIIPLRLFDESVLLVDLFEAGKQWATDNNARQERELTAAKEKEQTEAKQTRYKRYLELKKEFEET